jgi:murein DD-endopeptidase MepM/ murein hydrolase activator NlpD
VKFGISWQFHFKKHIDRIRRLIFISFMQQKIISKIIHFIEETIEHHLFKPVCVSLITSFILFNGFSYLQNRSEGNSVKQEVDPESKIKINIPDSYNFTLKQNQDYSHKVKSGDNLLNILLSLGVDGAEAFDLLKEMKKLYDPRSIIAGDIIEIKYRAEISYSKLKSSKQKRKIFITQISFTPSVEKRIVVSRIENKDGTYSFKAKEIIKKLIKKVLKYEATIKNGLYVDATNVGISPKIVIDMINLLSFDVDFQRDIRGGDKFKVLFESYFDEDGVRIKDGEILFTQIDLQTSNVFEMYRFKRLNSRVEYFNAKGRSVRKSLLRTPINGARISSGFGRRRHPVLGYRKMHKGIDFAAPRGTPIFAAGDGKITHYSRKGAYGNYVRIRHNSKYSTAYGHASRFVRGLRVGSRVKQGQVVAYVGTTGRSTGPHLHYEVLLNGKQINPRKIKGTSGVTLKGKELTKFKQSKSEIDKKLKESVLGCPEILKCNLK